jgi:hypothetical protein
MTAPHPPAGTLAGVLPGALAALGTGSPDPLGLAAAIGPVRQVVVLLVDGLGHRLLPAAARAVPLFADIVAGATGTLRELASAFPSTTPTSLVTLGTGTLPGAHGILGFTLNVPGSERVLTHIAWRDDPDPSVWQPQARLLDASAAVTTSVVASADYAGSGLSTAAYGTPRYLGTGRRLGLARAVVREVSAGTQLVYGYHPALDTALHLHGLDSDEWRAAAVDVARIITQIVERLPPDAVLLVTADHGGLDVPPDRRFDLDTDPRLRAGVRVVAGEPRARYLHTEPGATDDLLAAWRAVLGDSTLVMSREEAVATGWFGPVRPEHLPRIGDVVTVSRDDTVVLATAHEPAMVAKLVGFHGAATPAETAIPLIVLRR